MGKEVPRKEITKFALVIVGVLRAAAKGVVFIPKYEHWTSSDFNDVADQILERLREGKPEDIEELRMLYQETNGNPFDLWKVQLG